MQEYETLTLKYANILQYYYTNLLKLIKSSFEVAVLLWTDIGINQALFEVRSNNSFWNLFLYSIL